jgi:integrase
MAGTEADRLCATFFLRDSLGEALVPERIPYARQPLKLPIVLSADEVGPVPRSGIAALTTAYAAGLRASEVAGLRIEDIDSARGVIQARHGNGAKDRNVMLSPTGGSPGREFICSRDATTIIRSIRVGRLPRGGEGCGPDQARHAAHAAPQLRNTSPGEWNRYPDHSDLPLPISSSWI